MMPQEAPYGTWKSPVTVDALAQNSNDIESALVDDVNGHLYFVEQRTSEGGRRVIVDANTGKDVFDSSWNARTRVHEYGGVPAVISNSVVYFSSGKDGRVYRILERDGQPKAITPENKNWRFAELTVLLRGENKLPVLIAVWEDHTQPEPINVHNSLVIINPSNGTVTLLSDGADFYAAPVVSPNGKKIAWIQWYHPNMSWEGSQLILADIMTTSKDEIYLENLQIISGQEGQISVVQPQWATNDLLLFLNDSSGYSNPWSYTLSTSTSKPFFPQGVPEDFSEPAFTLGRYDFAVLDSNTVLFSSTRAGRSVLSTVDLETNTHVYLSTPYCLIKHLRRLSSNEAACICKTETDTAMLVKVKILSPGVADCFTVKTTTHPSLPQTFVSRPQSLSFPTDGKNLHEIVHVLYFPPFNPNYCPSADERAPPTIISAHGGPTDRADASLNWLKQFWTTRGWAWVDINYGGSSGYGKQYRDRLRGNWGVVDVQDIIVAVIRLQERGLVDPKRTVIRGESAGGFTVLACLVNDEHNLFRAATSCYGISDLIKVTEFTHKFESRYFETLVGGSVKEKRNIYLERSPITHVDKIVAPLLVLQGSIDPIVSPDQAETIVRGIKARNGHVKYILFDGESHGWRKAETIKVALETELAWYQRHLGIPGGKLASL